jgi:hypothetical protein
MHGAHVESEVARYLIFRREIDRNAKMPALPDGVVFELWRAPTAKPAVLGAILQEFGFLGTVKLTAKLFTPSRSFFGYLIRGRLASYGWISHGFCRSYPIEKSASVIGPIHTVPEFRGRGLVVSAMERAMIELERLGMRVFYIDAAESNVSSLRAINKAGFSGPVSEFDSPSQNAEGS